jgi:hypothetical protein
MMQDQLRWQSGFRLRAFLVAVRRVAHTVADNHRMHNSGCGQRIFIENFNPATRSTGPLPE